MPRRATPPVESVPPTITPKRGIELLQRQLHRLDNILLLLQYDDPEVKKWEDTTENILHAAFGKPHGEPHEYTKEFFHARRSGQWNRGVSENEIEHDYRLAQEKRKELLRYCMDQLDILGPPATQIPQERYSFHPEIERVGGQLYRDGHYKQAALEAYIRVIDEVKNRSGLNDDGDSLMNRAFGCDKHAPMIQFNSLQTDPERDEQKGLMFLFKGIVGLRNSKAHSNQLFDDPYRAHDYLALASLLMRLLEIATINRVP